METKQFKTTIKCGGCVAKVTPFLDEVAGKGNWEVDVANPSKILTVKSPKDEETVMKAVRDAGFKAEKI